MGKGQAHPGGLRYSGSKGSGEPGGSDSREAQSVAGSREKSKWS